jgi:gliding motility-associated-like protein
LPITVYPKPGSSINHNPEYITLSDNQVVFNPSHQAGPIVSTNWIFLGTKESMNGQIDSSGIRNPERVFETAGKYPVMLVSTTDKGCVDSVVKFIEVNEDFSVYIPNTFTPNGDGVNDVFMVKGTGMKIENYTMEIFDRWGTMLYSSKDITKGWDGSAKGAQLPIGAYIYKVKVIGANGQGKKEYVGHVTLMK